MRQPAGQVVWGEEAALGRKWLTVVLIDYK